MIYRNLVLLTASWSIVTVVLGNAARGGDGDKPSAGIGPTGKIIKLHTGFIFTEGPAPDRHGNVYFSDIPNERIHKVDKDGTLSIFREKSNRSNGLKVNARGGIVACEVAGRVVAISPDGKNVRVLADKFNDKPFNAPNDLVIDKQGGVYFTDPAFGAAKPLPQGKTCVYYIAPGGKVTRVVDDLNNPNGVMLSPDEKTLYVIPTGPAEMMAYPVESPGSVGRGRVFGTLQGRDGKKGTGGDGCTIDAKGNLYVTSQIGVQVFDPAGKFQGNIAFPEQPANVAFGGPDMKTLYVTARSSLYTAPMEAKGHVFPAGQK
jgi:gluconolactonase